MKNDDMHTEIAGLRFLIVEDNGFQRRILVKMLSSMGAKFIAEAVDGGDALDAYHAHDGQIDVSIIDLEMPGMDGMELIRHLAEEQHRGAVILASALGRPLVASVETMSRAYGIDLLGAIEKPLTRDNLQALIRTYQPRRPAQENASPKVDITQESIFQGLRDDQFEPFFQPKVALATGEVEGAEALARWRHPEHGLILPSEFIPLLEKNNLLGELTSIIFEKSIDACRDWHEMGMPLQVSCNLSLVSVTDTALLSRIADCVARKNMDPSNIIVEVTESVAMSDVSHCLENLARLRMKGFGLSIDDYGTGYSSLQQLLRVPFTELKIDRSFVAGAADSDALKSVLSSSIELCKKLDLRSVAEGIESQRDWDTLSELGCDLAQGYLIAKPMSADAFCAWLEQRNGRAVSSAGHYKTI